MSLYKRILSVFNIYIIPILFVILIVLLHIESFTNSNYILYILLYIIAVYSIINIFIENRLYKLNAFSGIIVLIGIVIGLINKALLDYPLLGDIKIWQSGIFIIIYSIIIAFIINNKDSLFRRLINKYDYDIINISGIYKKIFTYILVLVLLEIFLSLYFRVYPQSMSSIYYYKYLSIYNTNDSNRKRDYLLEAIKYDKKTNLNYYLELANLYENQITNDNNNYLSTIDIIYNNMLPLAKDKTYINILKARLYTNINSMDNFNYIYNLYINNNKNEEILSILIEYGLRNKYYNNFNIDLITEAYNSNLISIDEVKGIGDYFANNKEEEIAIEYYGLII